MRTLLWFLGLSAFSCAGTPAAPSSYRAGTSRAKITPAEPVLMYGYGSRNKPSEGVAAELWARALALDDGAGGRAVIVTADIGEFDPVQSVKLKDEIRRRHGLGPERVLLVGSHTHSGPELDEKTPYPAFFRARILEAVAAALADLEPASLSFGRGEVRFGANRRVKQPDGNWGFGNNPGGVTDPDLPLLKVSARGGLKALVFTHACHCTSVRNRFEGFYRIHSDWARCAEFVEAKQAGAQVMFVTGCGADIDPPAPGGIDVAERHARTMADALEKALGETAFQPVGGPLRLKYRRITLPLDRPSRGEYEKQAQTAKGADQEFAQKMLKQLADGSAATSLDYPIAVWHFGKGLTLVALAGETCVDYALRLKRELGAEGLWVAGYCNEVYCYIPSERVLDEGGYEAGWHRKSGRGVAASQMAWAGFPAPLAPGTEERVIRAVHELLRD